MDNKFFIKKNDFNIFNTVNTVCLALTLFAALYFYSGCKKEIKPQKHAVAKETYKSLRSVPDESRPNVILIIANDFGFELPEYNGGESYTTPGLNYLAANGMFFQQAYNHPDGSPSRIAILTGKYNFRNYKVWGLLPYGQQTIGNLLEDAGYQTCWAGKWQLNGGNKRILDAGFANYMVYLPTGYGQRENRYKNPKLFSNNAYLPDSAVAGKYSEDICTDYLDSFIDANKSNSFFGVYATLLPASPWVPTPDNPDYPNWNPQLDLTKSNKKYFKSMVAYMDKMVSKIRQKLEDDSIADNTIIMFCSATQTFSKIASEWRGQLISGTKTTTNKEGTNSPLLVYWPSHIMAGSTSEALVDFTDFLPTLADIAGVPRPTNYGILDGTSFYDNMLGIQGEDRDWVFCHWDNNTKDNNAIPPERFINDTTYKLYDTVGTGNGKFYNISLDPTEKNPISDTELTQDEMDRKLYFRSILDTLHK